MFHVFIIPQSVTDHITGSLIINFTASPHRLNLTYVVDIQIQWSQTYLECAFNPIPS